MELELAELLAQVDYDQAPLVDRLLIGLIQLELQNTVTLDLHSQALTRLERKARDMSVDLTALQKAANDAIQLIETLAANNDDAAVQAQVDSVSTALEASVTSNTPPVTPEPAPEPTPAV